MLETLQGTSGKMPCYMPQTKCWVSQLKRGKEGVEVEPRSRRPSTAATPENNDLVLERVMEDRRLSARQRAARLGISQERVGNILTKELGLRMVPAQWVPHLLSRKQKRSRWPCAAVIWNFLELINTTFGHYLWPQAIPGPSTTSWIQNNSPHEFRTHSHPPKERKDSLGFLLGFSGNFKGIARGLSPKCQDHQCTM